MEEKVSRSFQNNNNNVFIFDCFLNNLIEFEVKDLQSKQLKEILSILKSKVKFERFRDFIIILANEGKLEVVDSNEKLTTYKEKENYQDFIIGGFFHNKSPDFDHIRQFYYKFCKELSNFSSLSPISKVENPQDYSDRKDSYYDLVHSDWGNGDNKELNNVEAFSILSSKAIIDTYRNQKDDLMKVRVSATEFVEYNENLFLVFGSYNGDINYLSIPTNDPTNDPTNETKMKSSINLARHSKATNMLVRRIHFMKENERHFLLTCSDDGYFKVWKIDYKSDSLTITEIPGLAPINSPGNISYGCLHNFSLISESKSKYLIAFATEKEGLVMANLDLDSVKINFWEKTYKLDSSNKAMSVIIHQSNNSQIMNKKLVITGFLNMETVVWEILTNERRVKYLYTLQGINDVVYSFQTYLSNNGVSYLLCGTEKGSLVKLEIDFKNGVVGIPDYKVNDDRYGPQIFTNPMTITKNKKGRINQILLDESQNPPKIYLCSFDSFLYRVPIDFDISTEEKSAEVVFSFRDGEALKKNEIARLRSISIYTDSKGSYLAIGGENNQPGAGRVVVFEVL